jgi:hypothetical protein
MDANVLPRRNRPHARSRRNLIGAGWSHRRWLAGAAAWWFYGRGVEVTAVAAARGTAVEIVYATGAVEPVRWAKVTTVIRDRIVDLPPARARRSKPATCWRGSTTARRRPAQGTARARGIPKREVTRVTELMARGATTSQAFERASRDACQIQALIALQEVKINDYLIRLADGRRGAAPRTARSARSPRSARSCSASACRRPCRSWPRSTRRTSRA